MPTKSTKSTNLRRKAHKMPKGKSCGEGRCGEGRTNDPSAFGAGFVGIVGIVDFVDGREEGTNSPDF